MSALMLSFPWHERLSSLGIIMLSAHWLMDRQLLSKIKAIRFSTIAILSFSFFLWHLVSLAWTSYPEEAAQTIEVKLSLFILPILFSGENYFTDKNQKLILGAFIISCVAAFVYMSIHASLAYPWIEQWSEKFQRMNFSAPLMHPGYLSNYFIVALIFWVKKKEQWLKSTFGHQSLYYLVIISCAIAILFLASRTVMLFVLMIIPIYLYRYTSQIVKHIGLRVLLTAVVLVGTVLVAYQIPVVKLRVQETMTLGRQVAPSEVQVWDATLSRVAVYSLSAQLISQSPWIGYGVGAANPMLLTRLQEHGYIHLASIKLHTHNQYFHTWLDLGIIGLLLLLSFLASFYAYAWHHQSAITFLLALLTTINLLTDDMFEIQAGIVFLMILLFAGSISPSKPSQLENL